jgi:hypothetical protein
MNYNEIPRPEIEQHYHIQDLIEAQEKRTTDRNYHRNRLKELAERESLIKDSQEKVLTDFYCDECKKDFKAEAIRQVEIDWSNSSQRIAFYKTKCFRGHWCIRLISDRHKDAFWQKSKLVQLDKGNNFRDTIQPFQTGFNLLYGHKQ